MKRKFVVILLLIVMIAAYVIAEEDALIYDSGKKKNPFIPYVTNDGQLINIQEDSGDIKLNLEGIFYDDKGQSMVIINGEILKKNDTLGNIKIVDIKKDSVVYAKDGTILTLYAERKE